jgi:4-hydroxyphenylpyruvate dioxygenase-like putative hemolysin
MSRLPILFQHYTSKLNQNFKYKVIKRQFGLIERIDHVQLAMPPNKEDLARTFYSDFLKLNEVEKPPELAKRGGCWFENQMVKVHLGVDSAFRPSKKAHIAFIVKDIVDLASSARKRNYEVFEEKDNVNTERIYIYDPFGNRLEFLNSLKDK